MSSSKAVNIVLKIFAKLNYYYEHSSTHRFFKWVAFVGLNSFFIGAICRWLKAEHKNSYAEGSVVIRAVQALVLYPVLLVKKIFLFLASLNSMSLNAVVFRKAIAPMAKGEQALSAFLAVMLGIFVIRFDIIPALVFLVLNLIDAGFLLRVIKGCVPSRLVLFFYNKED